MRKRGKDRRTDGGEGGREGCMKGGRQGRSKE